MLEIKVDGKPAVYARDDTIGKQLAERYVWMALADGAQTASVAPVDRYPQGAERIDI